VAHALVANRQGDWITKLVAQRKVKVYIYHCSEVAARIADVTGPEAIGQALQRIPDLKAEAHNDSSQLSREVRQVLNDFRGSSPAAHVKLTHGATTEGEDVPKVSRYAAMRR
jgi:hypothetical protein